MDTPVSTPSTIGTNTSASPVEELALDIIQDLQETFSDITAVYQIGAIIVALFLASYLARFWLPRLRRMIPKQATSVGARLQSFVLRIVDSLFFSLVAASILALLAFVMVNQRLVDDIDDLILIRLAYTILYAWALLQLLIRCLIISFGGKLIGPGMRNVITIIFWIAAALHIVGILPLITQAMRRIYLPIGETDTVTLWSALVGTVTIILMVGAANTIANLAEVAITNSETMDVNLKVVLARICRITLIVLATLLALDSVGIDLGILSVFGGALGVGIGFGLQKIASNYISGFIILFDRSIKIGDFIDLSGFRGRVSRINTRYTVIRNTFGEELVVPNDTFMSDSIKNYSLTDRASAQSIEILIDYDANVKLALEILSDILKSQPRILKKPTPWVGIKDLDDSGINLWGKFFLNDPERGTARLKSELYQEILTRYTKAGIEIPFNKLDVTLIHTDNNAY